MTAIEPWDPVLAGQIIADLKDLPGAMLPILHRLQHRFGYIDGAADGLIAQALRMTVAEVHGVVSFYPDFRRTAPGRHRVKLCRAEACQAMGCRDLERHAQVTLGIAYHETTRDRRVTLEPVYCLGNCALAPAVMIDDTLYGRVDQTMFDGLLQGLGRQA